MRHWRSAILAAAGALLTANITQAVVTVQVRISGIANYTGTPTNGMYWGLVVDTSKNGFQFLNTPGQHIDPVSNILANGYLSVGGATTDDFYLFNNNANPANQKTITGPPPAFATGYIGDTGPFALGTGGIATGDQFGLIWWQTDGSPGASFGFYTNSSLIIPADGTYNFSTFFAPATAQDKTAQYLVVPEPSPAAAFAGGLALLGLAHRFRSHCGRIFASRR